MKIGFFGAGKVAVSLGKYFKDNGLDIAGFYSKTFASTEFARDFTETNGYSDLESFVLDCDIIFITTNDDELVNGFNEISSFNLENKISLMSSGIAAMTFYVGVGNEVKILHRFISIIIGFIIWQKKNKKLLQFEKFVL